MIQAFKDTVYTKSHTPLITLFREKYTEQYVSLIAFLNNSNFLSYKYMLIAFC